MNRKILVAYAVGPISVAALGAITIPFLTWTVPPGDVGRFALTQSLLTGFVIAASLGLDQAYARNYFGSPDRERLLRACLKLSSLIVVGPCLAFILFPGQLSNLIFGTVNSIWAYLFAFTLAASIIYRFFTLRLRMQERAWSFSISQATPRLALLLSLITTWALTDLSGMTRILIGLCVGSTSGIFLAFALRDRAAHPSTRASPAVGPLLRYGLPLAGGGVIFWLLSAAPIMGLRLSSQFDQLALYGTAVNFAAPIVIVQLVISTIWAPTLFKLQDTSSATELVDSVIPTLLLGLSLAVPVVAVCGRIVPLILPSEYHSVVGLIPLAMLPPTFYIISEIAGCGLQFARKTAGMLWSSISGIAVTIASLTALVQPFGAAGALFSATLGYLVFISARVYFSSHFLPVRHGRLSLGVCIALAALATADALFSRADRGGTAVALWVFFLFIVAFRILIDPKLLAELRGRAHA